MTFSKLKAGIFSEGLRKLLKENTVNTDYAYGQPQHNDAYTVDYQ